MTNNTDESNKKNVDSEKNMDNSVKTTNTAKSSSKITVTEYMNPRHFNMSAQNQQEKTINKNALPIDKTKSVIPKSVGEVSHICTDATCAMGPDKVRLFSGRCI